MNEQNGSANRLVRLVSYNRIGQLQTPFRNLFTGSGQVKHFPLHQRRIINLADSYKEDRIAWINKRTSYLVCESVFH